MLILISGNTQKPKMYHYTKITSEYIVMSNSSDRLSPKAITKLDTLGAYYNHTISFLYGQPADSLVVGCCRHNDKLLIVANGKKVNDIWLADALNIMPGVIRLENATKLLSLENNWFCSQGTDIEWNVNNYKVIFNNPIVRTLGQLLIPKSNAVEVVS